MAQDKVWQYDKMSHETKCHQRNVTNLNLNLYASTWYRLKRDESDDKSSSSTVKLGDNFSTFWLLHIFLSNYCH